MSKGDKTATGRGNSPLLRQILLVAIVALWAVGYLGPALSRANLQGAEWGQTQRLVTERRSLIAQRRQIIDRYREMATQDNLPDSPQDETGLMRALANQASSQNVQIVRINPVPERLMQGLKEIGAEIQITGDADRVVRFVHELENGADPLVVKQLNIRVPAGQTRDIEARLVAVKYLQ